jgi:hypothetical protein
MMENLLSAGGRAAIRGFGFISPRAVGDTTFLYGELGSNWLVRLAGDTLLFYGYNPVLGAYEPEPAKTTKLPRSMKEGSLLVHVDTASVEKNVFSTSFAILEEENGRLTVHIANRTESFDMLPDIWTMLGKAALAGAAALYKAAGAVGPLGCRTAVSLVGYRTSIPYSRQMRVFGGRGTIVIHSPERLHVLSLSGGKLSAKQCGMRFAGRAPVFEITGKGAFAAIDGRFVTLCSGQETKRIDLAKYRSALALSEMKYALVNGREGRTELYFYCDSRQACLRVEADPSGPAFGSASLLSVP